MLTFSTSVLTCLCPQEYYTARQNQNIHASESSQKLSLFAYSMSEEYSNWPENLTVCDLFSCEGVIELHLLHKTDVSIFHLNCDRLYLHWSYWFYARWSRNIEKMSCSSVVEKLYDWLASFLFFKCIANIVSFSDQSDLLSHEKKNAILSVVFTLWPEVMNWEFCFAFPYQELLL